jgi:hypothetical protein
MRVRLFLGFSSRSFCRIILLGFALLAGGAAQAATIGIEGEAFQFYGDWKYENSIVKSSNTGYLFASPTGAVRPAVTAVSIPQAGVYHLWVRSIDFPDFLPGRRRCTVSVDGTTSTLEFGDSNNADWTWEPGGDFTLPAGNVLIAIHDTTHYYARVDAVLLTTDAALSPSLALNTTGLPRNTPVTLPVPADPDDPLAKHPLTDLSSTPLASLENEYVRLEFLPALRDGVTTTVRPRVLPKVSGTAYDAGVDATAEAYMVSASPLGATYQYSSGYPYTPNWPGRRAPFTAEANGVQIETAILSPTEAIWNAGELLRYIPRTATTSGTTVRIEFYPQTSGTLQANWSLPAGDRTAHVALDFVTTAAGQYGLGYHLPISKTTAQINELLLPMLWQRRRLSARPYTVLQPMTPTPLSLVEYSWSQGKLAMALAGDPATMPYEWPNPSRPRFGLTMSDGQGHAQPTIYGPVPGSQDARTSAGATVRFAFRLLAQPGDWYAGYRTVADNIFGLRDYRENTSTSLTDAAFNMIDLMLDDTYGGWWTRAKAFYQIESLNGSSESVPQVPISAYLLTGNEDLYQRRALPTLEYLLSSSNAHFAVDPANTGVYVIGGMSGPAPQWGTSVLGGAWMQTQQLTPAFEQFALPGTGVRNAGGGHWQSFDDWLGRYRLTGETSALNQAKTLATSYIASTVNTATTTDFISDHFFLVSCVPDWEGLLRMYEATNDTSYLNAAVFGARQLMTGIWTQPLDTASTITVHPNGSYFSDQPSTIWWKGPDTFRLGYPRTPGDTPPHVAPAWVTSNVGLTLEGPGTLNGKMASRLIYQANWCADFLRLAAYTGDAQFETYARNSIVGRWANYSGYYVTGYTDLQQDPQYPYVGPDVSSIYYHHLPVHLGWTIDYLVADAFLLSGKQITFPSQVFYGYAYFDGRTYGHAPGRIFGDSDAWLWLRRGLITLDNPQINYLTAHRGTRFYAVLMNQSHSAQDVQVHFEPQALGYHPAAVTQVGLQRSAGNQTTLPLNAGTAAVSLPARGLAVLTLDGFTTATPPSHQILQRDAAVNPTYAVLPIAGGLETRAATIQVTPGAWTAYVWCTAYPTDLTTATLNYSIDGGPLQQLVDTDYPFEFSIPVASPASVFTFSMDGIRPDTTTFTTAQGTLGAVPLAPTPVALARFQTE